MDLKGICYEDGTDSGLCPKVCSVVSYSYKQGNVLRTKKKMEVASHLLYEYALWM
jgi:hypothetical protein